MKNPRMTSLVIVGTQQLSEMGSILLNTVEHADYIAE